MPEESPELRVGVLGSVCVWQGSRLLPVGPPQRQTVLAALAAHRNHAISMDRLIEAVWGDAPPSSATNRVHVHLSGLRKLLEPERPNRATGQVLRREASTYRLSLRPDQFDLDDAAGLLRRASSARATGDFVAAVGAASEALGLWRGEALAGIAGAWADAERARIEDLRLGAIEGRAEDLIRLGRSGEVANDLGPLVERYRFRERLGLLLMLALNRAGRQAEALRVYGDIRRHLAETLGLDPGDVLQRLHHDILTGESGELERYDRATDRVVPNAGSPTMPAPRELPADVAAFTGRGQHLTALDELLPDSDRPSSTVVISAVSGAGGVGKTALAVHWAHTVADRFPDGQLYIDLGGYDRAEPVAPAAALARFLRSLGMDGTHLPQDEAELAARYRSMMAGRRMIVVLDNARTAEQVRPLLPGTPQNLVLVTSRDDLAGLVARDGARRVDVDSMSPNESIALLRALIGPAVEHEPVAAREMAARCGHLPLALRIAAELSRSRPDVHLAEIVEDLREEHRRLDLLDDGGDPRAIRAVFGWSVRHLSKTAASAFTMLGAHPGRDFDLYALAALTAADLDSAWRMASELVRSNIINAIGPRRYAMHDLMRSYATERAAAEIEPATARAALARLFGYYLHAAASAVRTTYPHLTDEFLQRGDPQWPIPSLEQPEAAQRWLDVERANLTAMVGLDGDWPHRVDLSMILHRYLIDQAHHADALVVHRAATAQTAGRDGHVLNNLATTLYRRGEVVEAIDHLNQALDQSRAAGDAYGEGRTLANLGFIESCRAQYRQALDHQGQALDAYRRAGIRHLEAMTFVQVGYAKECLGRYLEAADAQHAALAICREHDFRLIEGYALGALGSAYGRLGRESEAIELIGRCLDICDEFNDEASQVGSQVDLARIHLRQGRCPEALARLELAQSIAERIGQPYLQVLSLNGLGETLRAMGRPSEGLVRHRAAFAIACRLHDRYQGARALDGIASVLDLEGKRIRAARLWRRALSSYTELGVPEAFELQQRLAAASLVASGQSGK